MITLIRSLVERLPLGVRIWALAAGEVGFLRASPLRVGVLVVASGLGAVAGVPPGNLAYDYSWKDYRFCDDCHVHDYANEAYERSVHFGLTTCHDCHRVPIRHYPLNLYLTIVEGKKAPEEMHAPNVATVVCAQCHAKQPGDEPLTGPMPESVRKRVVKVDGSPLHLKHLRSKTRQPGQYRGGVTEEHGDGHGGGHGGGGGHDDGHGALPAWAGEVITCMDCHGSEANRAHTFGASRDNCAQCHEEIHVGGERLERISCQECHFWGFAGSPDGVHVDEGHGHEGEHGEDAGGGHGEASGHGGGSH